MDMHLLMAVDIELSKIKKNIDDKISYLFTEEHDKNVLLSNIGFGGTSIKLIGVCNDSK